MQRNDDLFRIERIRECISQCLGVMQAYDLNMAEAAYTCASIQNAIREKLEKRVNKDDK